MNGVVDIQNELGFPLDSAHLELAAQTVLAVHEVPAGSEMTVVITDDATITRLNREYRGIDAPTDVLSFPADSMPEEIDAEPPYLGDLVIAYPYALAQAQREGHAPGDSFALLVVHGTLHLLGYDHDTPENRSVMWQAQEKALLALEISPEIVPVIADDDTDDDGGLYAGYI
jgi:probable rRNA maturation factor